MKRQRPAAKLLLASVAFFIALSCGGFRADAAQRMLTEPVVRAGDPLEAHVEEVNDEDGRYDIEDVTAPPISTHFRFGSGGAGQRLTRCRWYRFTLAPELERSGPWVLSADAESVSLFEPTKTGYRAEWFGTQTPVTARRLKNGLPNVDLLHGDYGRTLYVRINGPEVPLLRIRTLEATLATERELDLSGVFFGAIFGVLMIAAILFALITRVRAFAYYSIYMATQTLNQLNGLPFANRELWPNLAEVPWIFDIVYVSLLPISFMMFLRSALATKQSPILDRLMLTIGITDSVVGSVSLSLDRYRGTTIATSIVPLLYVATLAIMSGIAFVRWRQRYVSAGIYLIGLAGVLVGFAAYSIVDSAIDTADIGFVWEAVAFLAAIGYRLVQVTKDRESALAETVVAKDAVAEEYALRIDTVERFNAAFSRFVPRAFLEQLGREDVREVQLGDHVEREMTVLFCDIRAFVALSEQLTPQATFDFLNLYFGRVGPVVRANNGFVDKYVGDGVMALFPGPADDAIRAAIELHAEVRRFNEARAREGGQPIDVGVGLHRGPLMLATIGERERYDTTVIADVVNVAARLEGLTNVYGARIIVSDAVIENAVDRNAYNLRWLGELRVRGSAMPTSAYEVCDGDAAQLLLHKRATAPLFAAAMAAYRRSDFAVSFAMFAELVRGEAQDAVARFFMERSNTRAESPAGWDGVDQHDMKR